MMCPSSGSEISNTNPFSTNCCSRLAGVGTAGAESQFNEAGGNFPASPPVWASPAPKKLAWKDLWLRYFAHGALFSLLMLFLALVWIVVTVPLVLCGAFIGLAIALFLLVMAIGYLNTFLTELIWDTSMDFGWKSVFVHGLLLMVVLLVASVPSIILRAVTNDLAVAVALFLVYSFIDGAICRRIAILWSRGPK